MNPSPAHWRLSLSAAIAISILLLLIAHIAMMMRYHTREVQTYDFLAFYTAGRIVNEFGPARLYNLETQRALQRKIEPRTDERPMWTFLNPPFVALYLALPANFSYRTAYILVLIINLIVFTAAMLIGTRGLSKEMRFLCTLGALAGVPAYYAFYNGQLVCWLLLFFALFLHDLRRGADRRAGIWLALLSIKFQVMMVPVLLLAWKRRFQTLGTTALALAALGGISLWMVGVAGAKEFWQIMRLGLNNDPTQAFFAETMHNWRGFFLRAQIGEWTTLATLAACAATLALLFWIWRGRWHVDGPKLIALIFATLLVSPHCHWHDYLLIGLVFALLVPLVKEPSTMWLMAATTALTTWATLWLPENFSPIHVIAVVSLLVIGLTKRVARQQARDEAWRVSLPNQLGIKLERLSLKERRFLHDQKDLPHQL